ncbi:MAG: response regulator transcription factor [Bacteroidetes bacterium]|nr:response regulator transcription factor [Bacteroidota bacterium]MCB0841678.1 response regulator transcription factor [Bacteroidota bacterium]MCB0852734.1 response regulator transcription factor [Bacteroidota bacterium]
MKPSLIHTALVEDDHEIRQLLKLIIDGSPGFTCNLAFEDAESAIEGIPRYRPDIVLMDIDLPGMSGISCVRELKNTMPDLDIIMLTIKEDDESVFESLCAGASGYLVKETPPVELLAAIQEAHQGGAPMSAHIARKIVSSFHAVRKSPLSSRETEVLRMLCKGDNYKSIAEAIFVSTNTVKAHIKNIYKKLHVHTRAEAVSKALKDRLI